MKAFYYLNYAIYSFYLEKRDSVPASASFFLSILCVWFNLFTLEYWISVIFEFAGPFSKARALISYIVLGIINYLVLYRAGRYKIIFDNYNRQAKGKKNTYVLIYILLTIVVFLSALVVADIKKDGHL